MAGGTTVPQVPQAASELMLSPRGPGEWMRPGCLVPGCACLPSWKRLGGTHLPLGRGCWEEAEPRAEIRSEACQGFLCYN